MNSKPDDLRNKNRCEKCFFPKRLCLCSFIVSHKTKASFVIIMNKGEHGRISNTGRLLSTVLDQCEIKIRGLKDHPLSYPELIEQKSQNKKYVLFPSDQAVDIKDSSLLKAKNPVIFVPDGNWNQGAKIARRLARFSSVEAIKIPFLKNSTYQLRYNPNPSRMSTFEAVALLLKNLEGEDCYNNMMEIFQMMVRRVLLLRGKINKESYLTLLPDKYKSHKTAASP